MIYHSMNHGIAICIKSFKEGVITESEKGIITAYLPDMERFAVWFNNEKWITFQWSEEEFLRHFKVVS